MKNVWISMISFAAPENCVKWHMDTCLSVQNKQKNKETFGRVHNLPVEDTKNEDKCGAFVLVLRESYPFLTSMNRPSTYREMSSGR